MSGRTRQAFIDASTGDAAKQQQHKQYGTTHADQTYRQNTNQQKKQNAAGLDRDVTGRANGLKFLLYADVPFCSHITPI